VGILGGLPELLTVKYGRVLSYITKAHYQFSLPLDSSEKAFRSGPVPTCDEICGAERPENGTRFSKSEERSSLHHISHFHCEKRAAVT
jgi:hypothetical protein